MVANKRNLPAVQLLLVILKSTLTLQYLLVSILYGVMFRCFHVHHSVRSSSAVVTVSIYLLNNAGFAIALPGDHSLR